MLDRCPMSLPALPSIDVRVLEEISPAAPVGFLHLRRRRVQLCYPDGQPSHPFVFDCVETGRTMAANRLTVIEKLMTSTTHMVAGRDVVGDPAVRALAERLRRVLP